MRKTGVRNQEGACWRLFPVPTYYLLVTDHCRPPSASYLLSSDL
jgi:hypothetical protein